MASRKKKIVGERLPGPSKIRLGDVVAIPLGEGYWGYARECRDGLAVSGISSKDKILELNDIKNSDVLFYTFYIEPWDEPTWVYLGTWPYENEEEGWPPPVYKIDILNSNKVDIYHKGRQEDHAYSVTDIDDLKKSGMKEYAGSSFPGHLAAC